VRERERETESKKKIQELYLKIKTLVDKLLQRNSTIGSEIPLSQDMASRFLLVE